jgi:hypothetical protein
MTDSDLMNGADWPELGPPVGDDPPDIPPQYDPRIKGGLDDAGYALKFRILPFASNADINTDPDVYAEPTDLPYFFIFRPNLRYLTNNPLKYGPLVYDPGPLHHSQIFKTTAGWDPHRRKYSGRLS